MEYDRLILEVEAMNELLKFLTTEEMIMVYVLVGVASILYFLVYFLDKTAAKRKQKQNTRELKKSVLEDCSNTFDKDIEIDSQEPILTLSTEKKADEPILLDIEEIKPELEVSKIEKIEDVSSVSEVAKLHMEDSIQSEIGGDVPKDSFSNDGLQYTSIEPNPTEAQAELMRLTETLEKAEEEVKNIDLTAFEEEQEQNAIISLDELMKRNKILYENGQLEQLQDEGNEPISLQDLEERMKVSYTEAQSIIGEPTTVLTEDNISVPKQMALDDFKTVSVSNVENVKLEEKPIYQEHKKFKSSPVISPVFGIEKPTVNNSSDIELENTANYEKLDEEIRKTNEFLMTLKELQKKLD